MTDDLMNSMKNSEEKIDEINENTSENRRNTKRRCTLNSCNIL